MSTLDMQLFPCPHCPAKFDSFKSLEQHLRSTHSEAVSSAPFRCVTCDAEFMEQAEWLRHLGEEHGDAAPREGEPSG
jgi:uncharacterized C2H2 Zn-finger protein